MTDEYDFVILDAYTKSDMEAKVIKCLNLGYILAGSLTHDWEAEAYTQAVIKNITRYKAIKGEQS